MTDIAKALLLVITAASLLAVTALTDQLAVAIIAGIGAAALLVELGLNLIAARRDRLRRRAELRGIHSRRGR